MAEGRPVGGRFVAVGPTRGLALSACLPSRGLETGQASLRLRAPAFLAPCPPGRIGRVIQPATVPPAIRPFLLAILLLGMLGTAAELLLLGHDEEAPQLIPLAGIAVAVAVIAWHAVDRRAASVRALQLTMLLLVGAGVAGVVLHLRGSMEFQLETDASLGGWQLFWKAMRAKNPPALAPGIMAQLGLLGLAYAHRHPALGVTRSERQDHGRAT